MTPRRLLLSLLSAAAHGSGWTTLERRRRHRRGDVRLYILEYHDLCGDHEEEREGVVRAGRLAQHVRWLARRFHLVTVGEGAQWLSAGGGGNQDRLAITFDDGYVSNYQHAWPVLRAATAASADGAPAAGTSGDVPATIFLATGFMDGEPLWFDKARLTFSALRGREDTLPTASQEVLRRVLGRWPYGGGEIEKLKYADCEARHEVLQVVDDLRQDLQLDLPPTRQPMSWQQVQEMQAGGIEMAAHTVTHPILSRQSAAQQEDEIRRSRQRIVEMTGVASHSFAFPNGSERDFDPASLEILQRLGFTACCTTQRGSNRPGDPLLTLRRLGVGADSTTVLAARLAGLFDQGMRRFLPNSARTAPIH